MVFTTSSKRIKGKKAHNNFKKGKSFFFFFFFADLSPPPLPTSTHTLSAVWREHSMTQIAFSQGLSGAKHEGK